MTPPRGIALVLGLLAAFGPLSIDMYLPALPEIGRALGGDPAITLATFFAGMAAGQLLHGPMADRHGRRRPLFVALLLYIAASVGCALAADMDALALLRLLQALGGCAGMVVARAVVRDLADQVDPVRLMGRLMLVMGVAPILAPMLGGWVAAAIGWRGIFWVLAAIGLLALLVTWRFLPDTLPPERRRVVPLRQVLRGYVALLGDARFLAAALASACAVGGMFAWISGSPRVFIELYGVRPERYGLFFGGAAAAVIALSFLAGRIAARVGRERLFSAALMGLAAAGLTLPLLVPFGLWPLYAGLVAYVAMMGLLLPLASVLAMQPFPQMAGAASALLGTMQFGLGAVVATLLALLPDGTAWPMAGIIALCGVAALTARLALARPAAAA
ncbi:MAG: Bcr/CflA family multidrug efflux MFS transporter [Acetobacteraceae bacterium]|nr:Bcr/CflA family multidrug efflux MFS transporter [Acetobacteraceae bacterium]